MVWSYDPADTFDLGNKSKNIIAFMATMDGVGDKSTTQGGWTTVITDGTLSGASTAGNLVALFEFTNPDGTVCRSQSTWVESQSSYFMITNSILNPDYDPTIVDKLDRNFWPYSISTHRSGDYYQGISGSDSEMRVWRSSLDPAAFICVSANRASQQFLSASSNIGYFPIGAGASNDSDLCQSMVYPSLYGRCRSYFNWPITTSYISSSYGSGLSSWEYVGSTSCYLDRDSTVILNQVGLTCKEVSFGTLADDSMLSFAVGTIMGQTTEVDVDITAAFDGTKYYAYLNDPTGMSFLIDCGATNPNDWLV